MTDDTRNALLVGGGITGTIALIVVAASWATWVPALVGPERWPSWGPFGGEPMWTLDTHEFRDVGGRRLLVVRDTFEWESRGEETTEVYVYRLTVLDRQTGERLGALSLYEHFIVRSLRDGRVWIERQDAQWPEAYTIPGLEREADLGAVVAGIEALERPITQVDFPEGTEHVRLTADDGFQWDLHPDLSTVARLHHDTPMPTTPYFGAYERDCPVTARLETGRIAMLGSGSLRPSLRIVDEATDVEAPEIETPHQGFLEGYFLCGAEGTPMVRAPESVFVVHANPVGARKQRLVTRVGSGEGMSWSRTTDAWLGAPFDTAEETEIVWAEDQGDAIVLWLRSGPADARHGFQALVAFDPANGDVRWVTKL